MKMCSSQVSLTCKYGASSSGYTISKSFKSRDSQILVNIE